MRWITARAAFKRSSTAAKKPPSRYTRLTFQRLALKSLQPQALTPTLLEELRLNCLHRRRLPIKTNENTNLLFSLESTDALLTIGRRPPSLSARPPARPPLGAAVDGRSIWRRRGRQRVRSTSETITERRIEDIDAFQRLAVAACVYLANMDESSRII